VRGGISFRWKTASNLIRSRRSSAARNFASMFAPAVSAIRAGYIYRCRRCATNIRFSDISIGRGISRFFSFLLVDLDRGFWHSDLNRHSSLPLQE